MPYLRAMRQRGIPATAAHSMIKRMLFLTSLVLLMAGCGRPSAVTAVHPAAVPETVPGNRFASVLDTLYGRLFYAIAETADGDSLLLIAHRSAIVERAGRNLAARWAWVYAPDTAGRIRLYGVAGRPDATLPLTLRGECLVSGDSLHPSAVTVDAVRTQLVPDSLSCPAPGSYHIIHFADVGNEE